MRSFFRIKISCSCWLQIVFNFGSENREEQLKSHPVNFLDERVPNNLKLKVIHTFVQKCVWKMIFSFLCKNLRNSPPLKLCSAQHFHPGGTWNGVKLCHWRWLDAVTRAEEGPLSYSVVVGGWTSLGPTTTTDQTPHPSIPLTSNQGLNPGNYTLWESEWQFFQRARSAIAIFQGWKRDRFFSRSTDRLSRIPTVLVGRCRSFVWPGPQYGVTQCKYFDRSWA